MNENAITRAITHVAGMLTAALETCGDAILGVITAVFSNEMVLFFLAGLAIMLFLRW